MNLLKISKKNKLFYDEPIINTELKKNVRLIYADYTGTGKETPIINKFMEERIFPYYANTHSNSYCSYYMNELIDNARDYIKGFYNITNQYAILFSGNGATGAINHFANILNTNKYEKINIIISSYEHHSNYLPWVKLSKEKENINLYIMPLKDIKNETFEIDYEWLDKFLGKITNKKNMTLLSVTACSNVIGIKTNIKKIREIINKYNNTFFASDCACIAPYERINGKLLDAFFISGHKFIGGGYTPGVLIVKKDLIMLEDPYNVGGGCVFTANKECIIYSDDIETRESAGTPNILGIIKFKKCLELQKSLLKLIKHNEKEIFNYVSNKLEELEKKYKNFKIIFPLNLNRNRLPIFCFIINEFDSDTLVGLLSKIFGIQSRGGISCCGILGDYIYKKKHITGWCRITFHWSMDKNNIDIILNGIEFLCLNAGKINYK